MIKPYIKYYIIKLVATFCYVGKIKYCPGTFGSLIAFPLSYIILILTISNNIIIIPSSTLSTLEQELISIFIILLLSSIILLFIGIYSANNYLKLCNVNNPDPSEVVIDEVVGQMLTITLCSFSSVFIQYSEMTNYLNHSMINFIFIFLMPFILFRLFDILKPWPINIIDQKVHGGLGIMLDDIVAAIFASVANYAITFMLIDLSVN